MHRLKKIFVRLTIFVVIVYGLAYVTDVTYLFKAVRTIYLTGHKTAYLEDYKKFDNDTLHKSAQPQPWPLHKAYNQVKITPELEALHQQNQSVAFLIIKNDSIWFEKYYDNFDQKRISNSFSMAKSVVSAALGKAIMEGKIKSLDEPVHHFLPQFNEGLGKQLTVGDLSSMASGLDWDESYYNPLSVMTRIYFYDDLNKMMSKTKVTSTPGKGYLYLSGNTQLLAMAIEKATGERLTSYVRKSFWEPMGAESDALWQTDKPNGMAKAYCCLASNARDFARFGKLYEHYGNWNGKQILDSAFVKKSTTPRFKASPEYGYGWWLANYKNKDIFYMRGHLGQNVIVIPQDQIIIVRLGHLEGENAPNSPHKKSFFTFIDQTYKMLDNARKN